MRDSLAPKFEHCAQKLLKNPWAARDQYIDVMLDRSEASIDRFFKKHTVRELDQKDRVLVLKLLELQRHAMLMYTSCGWFFDELSGIETVQVLRYAGRAVELAQQVFGDHLEASFLERLAKAKSNLSEHADGARVYETLVKASAVDLLKVGSHYAVSDVFEPYDDRAQVYCYQVERKERAAQQRSGGTKLVLGKAVFTSRVTREYSTLEYGVLHFGGYNVLAGVRVDSGAKDDRCGLDELVDAFSQSDEADLRFRLKQVFGEVHSFTALFKDRQREMLGFLSNSVMAEVEAAHRQIYEHHAELMRLLIDAGMPLPRDFRAAAESALNSSLRDAFVVDELEPGRVDRVLMEAKSLGIALDAATLEFVLRKRIETMAEVVAADFANIHSIARLQKAVALLRSLPFPVDLWWVQTLCHKWIAEAYSSFLEKAEKGDKDAQAWTVQVAVLSEQLRFLSLGGSVLVLPAALPAA